MFQPLQARIPGLLRRSQETSHNGHSTAVGVLVLSTLLHHILNVAFSSSLFGTCIFHASLSHRRWLLSCTYRCLCFVSDRLGWIELRFTPKALARPIQISVVRRRGEESIHVAEVCIRELDLHLHLCALLLQCVGTNLDIRIHHVFVATRSNAGKETQFIDLGLHIIN